jgi:UTP--glucose-1-phosphate uridylyltransferase
MSVKKAVFPVGGMGTRFLPATKANPKEMLPIVDKPLIQYAVEEAVAAGVKELIFVTSSSKRSIEDHFDSNYELETRLAEEQRYDMLKLVQEILPKHVQCCYVRQKQPLGLGHAVLCAKDIVGDEPFAVLLADDLIDATTPCLKQMLPVHEQTGSSVIAVESITPAETEKYGVVGVNDALGDVCQMTSIVEKPAPADAPSNLGVVGRYILTPTIFSLLEKTSKGAGGEIQLTDAVSELLKQESIHALKFEGERFDCGSKLGYLDATLAYALKHPELAEEFKDLLKVRAAQL